MTVFRIIFALVLSGSALRASEIVVEGSSTMARLLIQPLAGAWQKTQSSVSVRVIGNDSTNGIAALLDRRIDAAMVSRPPGDVENRLAQEAGLEWKSLTVATDELAVIIHRENTARSFTPKQIEQLFAGDITQWAEVGGGNHSVLLMMRKPNSGINAEWRKQAMRWREFASGGSFFPNDDALLTSLNATPGGLSVFSSAQPLPERLRRAEIHGPGWQRSLLLIYPDPPRKELSEFLAFIESPEAIGIKKQAGFSSE